MAAVMPTMRGSFLASSINASANAPVHDGGPELAFFIAPELTSNCSTPWYFTGSACENE
jgi:hypothetical protein